MNRMCRNTNMEESQLKICREAFHKGKMVWDILGFKMVKVGGVGLDEEQGKLLGAVGWSPLCSSCHAPNATHWRCEAACYGPG